MGRLPCTQPRASNIKISSFLLPLPLTHLVETELRACTPLSQEPKRLPNTVTEDPINQSAHPTLHPMTPCYATLLRTPSASATPPGSGQGNRNAGCITSIDTGLGTSATPTRLAAAFSRRRASLFAELVPAACDSRGRGTLGRRTLFVISLEEWCFPA